MTAKILFEGKLPLSGKTKERYYKKSQESGCVLSMEFPIV